MKKRILSLVALPGFFKGDFYEVSVDYIKTLFLGVRRSVVCVLSLVVLLACCVSPAYAEFDNTDSNNLSSIRTNVQNIWNRINTNFNYSLLNISNQLATISTVVTGINTNLLNTIAGNLDYIGDRIVDVRVLLASVSSKIDTMILNQETQIQNQQTQIGNQETQIQNQETQIENENQIIDNQDRLYDYLYEPLYGGVLDTEITASYKYFDGFQCYDGQSFFSAQEDLDTRLPVFSVGTKFNYFTFYVRPSTGFRSYMLVPGETYIASLVFPVDLVSFSVDRLAFNSVATEIHDVRIGSAPFQQYEPYVYVTVFFSVSDTVPLDYFSISFNSLLTVSYDMPFLVSFQPAPDSVYLEESFEGSVNSGQSQITNDVQSSVGQLDDFDNEIFQNVADYTAKLDFGLSSWGEAAAGISYIGSIFLMIWNNSPTQVVVLSLMIGLCILLLGRGARVAGAVRRSHRDDDGGGG